VIKIFIPRGTACPGGCAKRKDKLNKLFPYKNG
jgi:hypothetical protein